MLTYEELDSENGILFEQVQNLKRENNELKMKFVAANRKSIDLEHEVAYLKAEYEGYIEPPKDADGKYIHIGDVMECVYNGEKRQFPVSYLNMESDGWHVYLAVNDCVRQGYKSSELLHCRPDSWERIIDDARAYRLNIGGSYLWKNKSDELIARCYALCERTKDGDAE